MAWIRSRVILLAGLVLACAEVALGQVATGTPPFGSFTGGPGVVNLGNLNMHLTIPVRQKGGRGMDFTYILSYDSSIWYPVGISGSQNWQPVTNWGWAGQTQTALGYISYGSTTTTQCLLDPGPPRQYGETIWYKNWYYVDEFGTAHGFGLLSVSSSDCWGDSSGSAIATDGSGYTIHASGGPSASVTPRGGGVINAPLQSDAGSGSKQDANGNQITVSASSPQTFTDTLGTTALTINGSAPNPVSYTHNNAAGTSVSVTLNYKTYTVKTNFGATGISEYGPSSVSLLDYITLPNTKQYSFTYEQTPSTPTSGACAPLPNTYQGYCVTGRIASVTLPTGGQITYSYSGGSNGIFSEGSTATLTRTTPDGTWTYAHSESGTAWTTTITDPQQNQTVLNFQQIYETSRYIYQGSIAPANLLQSVVTCYNGNTLNCDTTAVTLPITRRTVTAQLGNLQSKQDLFYNSFGLRTEADEYDYGSGAPGSLVRKTLINYAALGNIVDRPATITIQDGAGSTKAQSTFVYDQTAVTATSGTPQHLAVAGSRGNPTTVTHLLQGAATLSRTFTYYDTGTVQTAADVNGASTTYTYGTGSCGNSFPTSASLPLGLSRSLAWNCTGGVMTSATDENNQTTTFTYNDPYFWRLNSATDPASNVTNLTYSGATAIESSMVFNGGSSTVDVLKTLDGLGRIHITQQKQAPSATNYDSVETDYDSLGRPSRVTLPYSGTAGQTNALAAGVAATYDALGRPAQATDGGGGTVTFAYTQNDVLRTVGPAPTGENTKRRQFEYDAPGRLTSVCELTSATGSGTCSQTSPATGYWTKYTYDVLGNLTGVTQNAQAAGPTQTRSYSYDGLSRITSEANAESGTTSYIYDSDATCGTSSGDLVKRVDAVGNTTCYGYDALHRVTSTTYSGPYAGSTPNKYFVYDSATLNSVVLANAKGRLAEAYTATCSSCAKITDVGLSYTARGEVSDVYESTPNSGGYYHVNATYWAHGVLNQLGGLPGLPTLTYTPDGEGRAAIVSASTGQNPVLSTTYNTASQATQVNLGSSDSDAFTFDPNTGRMTQYKYNVNAQSVIGNLGWNANGTLASLNITDPFNSANTQSCTYAYDDLGRMASVNCGAVWSQTFTYDAFGNLAKSGSMSFQPTYSSVTNQMTSLPGFTPSYDANGNVLNDSSHIYSWDAEGRPVTIDGVGLTYDAVGRMVEQSFSGAYTELVYAPTGNKMGLMNGQALQKAFVPLPAAATGVYNASGLSYYRHPDWLGSSRFASTPGRAMYSDTAYAPFGETYAQAGTTDLSFTGQNQDTVGGLYDFLFREYSTQGRWPSPDPAGLAAVDLSDPQSLDRYAYVRNDALNLIDPLGLGCRDEEVWVFVDVPVYVWNGEYWQQGWRTIWQKQTQRRCEPERLGDRDGGGGGGGGNSSGGGILSQIKSAVCSALPSGRTMGASGGLGGIGSVGGGDEVVVNYNSGQVSAFGFGGLQVGWNGGASGSIYTGFVYGLNNSNSNYSGGFTGVNGGAGLGGFAASSSGGLTGGASGLAPNGQVKVGGVSVGAGLIGGFSGGVTATNYTKPLQLGKFWAFGPTDFVLYAARQACK